MEWKDIKNELLKDKELRDAYNKIDIKYDIGKMVTDARIIRNITQKRLAEIVGTKQPSIARIERGSSLPSLSFLQKIAEALGTQLLPPKFELLEQQKMNIYNAKVTYAYDDLFNIKGICNGLFESHSSSQTINYNEKPGANKSFNPRLEIINYATN
jgi:transcriptional regulator with XRE-family HTH domain